MKRFSLLFFVFSTLATFAAGPGISDSLDIIHTTVYLNVTDYDGKTIQGKAILEMEAKVDGISVIPLDLLQLTVDSVWIDGNPVGFTQLGELVLVETDVILNTGDTRTVTVFYGGEPDKDSSWGGWYWSGDYAYQLGVGFDADPHNYGRIWFPCFDNFIERCTFSFHITTPTDFKAFCGGVLTDEIDNGDGSTTWVWELEQAIPSYLASVAVSTYATVKWNYEGIVEDIPVELGVRAIDSTKLKNSFIHLNDALSIFENSYGPYMWDRVGYVIVPFTGGAMEHACNIAYPSFAVDNTTNWELLMAHELSHHWWGNLITCSDASEMWLNEGWASYSEYLFQENVYGRPTYDAAVADNHLEIIHYGFANDGGNYFPLAEMPHDYTYGFTTYTRGAMTVHNLRGYMGDDQFFPCITSFLEAFAFQPVSSEQFRDYLSDCSGMDMNPFFEAWIFHAGTPAVEIDYQVLHNDGEFELCLEQKLNHAPEYFADYPVEVFLVDKDGHTLYKEKFFVEAPNGQISFSPPITIPEEYAVILDRNNLVADAVTADELFLTETGLYNLDQTLMSITVNALAEDTDWIRVEHYWVEADGWKEPVAGLHVNNQRYWRILGDFDGSQVTANMKFNGTASISGGYLDNEFITNSDDSLVLLYREKPEDDWAIYTHYLLDPWGNHTDKRGAFEISQLHPGEYAFGMYDVSMSDAVADEDACAFDVPIENIPVEEGWRVYPNPSDGTLQFFLAAEMEGSIFDIYSPDARLVVSLRPSIGTSTITLPNQADGWYLITHTNAAGMSVGSRKVLIIR